MIISLYIFFIRMSFISWRHVPLFFWVSPACRRSIQSFVSHENYWVRPQTCTFILIFVCVSLTILSLVSRKRTLLLSSKYLDVLRQSFGKLMTWLCYFNVWISVYKKKRGERQLVTLMVVHFLVKRRFLSHIILSTCKCKWRKIDTCTSVIIMWPLFFFLFLFLFVSFFVI